MSFTTVERPSARLNRSQLFVPGVRPPLFEKAATSDADVICLDLEDAVAPADKPQARSNVIAALKTVNFGRKSISVRINGLDTHWCYRDVVDIMEQAGERLDLIMIPKVGVAADVYAIDMLITQIETAIGRKKRARLKQHRRHCGRLEASRVPAFRFRRFRGVGTHAHDQHRRIECGLRHVDGQGRERASRDPLG